MMARARTMACRVSTRGVGAIPNQMASRSIQLSGTTRVRMRQIAVRCRKQNVIRALSGMMHSRRWPGSTRFADINSSNMI